MKVVRITVLTNSTLPNTVMTNFGPKTERKRVAIATLFVITTVVRTTFADGLFLTKPEARTRLADWLLEKSFHEADLIHYEEAEQDAQGADAELDNPV